MSIRIKVIFPFFLLTLVVAIVGTYVVTRLVADSLEERLTNQLLEAGRVVSDGMARQEIKHLETARVVAYTRGLAEALSNGDAQTVGALAEPVAAGLDVENLILVDMQGQEMLHLLAKADGGFQVVSEDSGAENLPIVQTLIASGDPKSLPTRGLALHSVDGQYYYYTAIPIELDDEMAGLLLIGTSLDVILPYLKSISLADVVFYGEDGQSLGTTLGGFATDIDLLTQLSIPSDVYRQILYSQDIVSGENFSVSGRWYSLARGPLKIGSAHLGVFGVVLPLNFVLQAGADSRNTYVLIFSLAMVAVVLIGYIISRLITVPLSRLVQTSLAIAGGDLSQRTGIRGTDEIGMLASKFDEMTVNLEERTTELQKTYHALEQMDRTKSSFITMAAHELRTPLTLISGYSQMLQDEAKQDAELGQLARGVTDGTKRMTEVVDGMLDVSRIDSQALKLETVDISISELLYQVQMEFSSALKTRELTLKLDGVDRLPKIQADPELLHKVFYHLVMNAIKYTPDGGTITVSGHILGENPEEPEVEIVVSDTGIGIDTQHIELIFEKFYQLGEVQFHSSGKTKFKGGGPGLGLAIARGVVIAHGGCIWAESRGHDEENYPGSSFFVRLPLKGMPV